MHTLSVKTQPTLRRVLDALGKLAFEFEPDGQQTGLPDYRASFLEGQKNVVKHYRHVLATQRMAPAERQAVLDRIARIETEIRTLEAPSGSPSSRKSA